MVLRAFSSEVKQHTSTVHLSMVSENKKKRRCASTGGLEVIVCHRARCVPLCAVLCVHTGDRDSLILSMSFTVLLDFNSVLKFFSLNTSKPS
jgi:hypothetical protein